MKLTTVKLTDLVPAPYNPRQSLEPGEPEYEALKASIEKWGVVDPLIVNKQTGHIVGGHQRLTVLRDLGHTTAQVVMVDVPADQEQGLNVALNKVTGRWDEAALAGVLSGLQEQGFDVALTGFSPEELSALLDDVGLYGTPPTLDDLATTHGEPLPGDFWPVLRVKLPPQTMELYAATLFLAPGQAEHERIHAILEAAKRAFESAS